MEIEQCFRRLFQMAFIHWRRYLRDPPVALVSVKAAAIKPRSYEGLLSQNEE
jgi:hypothetical protein